MTATPRRYQQVARAAASLDIRRRLIRTFLDMLAKVPLDDITLDELAARAGTTRQTLIRYFGSKDGLMPAATEQIGEDVKARRNVPQGASIEDHMAALVLDYDEIGDVIVQLLAQEARLPNLRRWLDQGRRGHREWITSLFAPWLTELAPKARTCRIQQLYAVTDVNTWRLLRRDFGHSATSTASMIADMARRLLDAQPQMKGTGK